MNNTFSIEVLIERIDKEDNQIIFKPYSSAYKHEAEEYPSKAINVSALDPNKDLKEQLLQLSVPIIREVLYKESPHFFEKLFQEIPAQQGTTFAKEITPEQLFEPATIFPEPSPENSAPGYSTESNGPSLEQLSSPKTFDIIA